VATRGGLDHYQRGVEKIVPPPDTQALAGAPEGALQNLPPERRKGLRPVGALDSFIDETPWQTGPDADYEGYFS
jgi:hypothetical protein